VAWRSRGSVDVIINGRDAARLAEAETAARLGEAG
jgi:hypothetical protein